MALVNLAVLVVVVLEVHLQIEPGVLETHLQQRQVKATMEAII
jgi:hypothetical protein